MKFSKPRKVRAGHRSWISPLLNNEPRHSDACWQRRLCSEGEELSPQLPVESVAIDKNDVETRAEPVDVTVVDPPQPGVWWFDGEYIHPFEPGQTFKVSQFILMASAVYTPMFEGQVTKLEVLANGVTICSDNAPNHGAAEKCVWTAAPGKYKLQTIATDADGAVGKSDPVEILVERP